MKTFKVLNKAFGSCGETIIFYSISIFVIERLIPLGLRKVLLRIFVEVNSDFDVFMCSTPDSLILLVVLKILQASGPVNVITHTEIPI